MIEQNIIEWLELGDSIQKIDLYTGKNSNFFFKANYLLSQYSQFSEYFYIVMIFLFYVQIWELNILNINVEGDGILEILKYLNKIFLINNLVVDKKTFIIFIIIIVLAFILSTLFSIINVTLSNKQKNIRFLISFNSFLNTLNLYYLNGPSLSIIFSGFLCSNGNTLTFCSLKNVSVLILFIISCIYSISFIIGIFFASLYFNNIGCINSSDVKSRINCSFTTIIVLVKMIYFIFHFILKRILNDKYYLINFSYYLIFFLLNFFISIYSYKELFYYNSIINACFHYGAYYTTWFSFCIFFKKLLVIKDITLFIIFGLIIITFGFYFNTKYKYFKLIAEFNIFETNNLKDIEIYNNLLINILKKNDHKSKILISGVIKRFEEYLSNNAELYEQYHKLLNDKHLQKKFSSYNELIILSIISIIYSHNIEKSKDSADITLNMCYFLVNKFKNPVYAIWLCTKIKACTHVQSYYKYVLMEEIKDYLIGILTKNTNKPSIKHVQISSVILYNLYVDLFKIKIYDATCSQIEYFDTLKNNITTSKTTENFLKIGEDILSLRQEILNLWEKIILLNPFSNESEKDYMIYLETILKDDLLMRTEEKRFNSLKAEKLSERNNSYYSIFIQDLSAVLLIDGYSYNGKIFYATPNFPSLFMLTGKEILNTSIDDLLPDVIQNFHRFLIEDAIKYSNLGYIFKRQRDVLLKGKNGLIFNVYLYVKPVPNLSFGLIYFSYLQKIQEQNFIIILDENLHINGFTELNQIGSNFTMNNNYGLSHYINGHHIGLIIPEIILQMDYDIKSNIFYLSKNNIDLKGYLYSINNLKDLDDKILKILEILKERKIKEANNENKISSFDEYDDFIKELSSRYPKPFSIFFRIESHSFIGGKYKYYRIYVINDLLSANENLTEIPSHLYTISGDEHHLKDSINASNISKIRLKDLKQDNNYTISGNQIYKPNKGVKLIRLKTEMNLKSNFLNKEELNEIHKQNNKGINLIEDENNNKNNNANSSNNNNKNININFSKRSDPSSILTQSSAESAEFNKLKNEIINKNDSFYVKLTKYLYIIFIFINILLIVYDYIITRKIIISMVEFLQQNLFFTYTKICSACIYNNAINLKFIKKGYIDNESCEGSKCHFIYANLLEKCLKEIREQKFNISYFYSDFQKIFNQKIYADLQVYKRNYVEHLSLDLDNFLNLMISHGIKIIANLSDYFDDSIEEDNKVILEINLENLLTNSLKYFYSDYSEFTGKEKEMKCNKVSFNPPIRLIISIILVIILIVIFAYFICKINFMELYFLDRLINFTSNSFEEYLKKLDELKKKFRDDTNDEDDKNIDDFDMKGEDIEGKNENNSKIKSEYINNSNNNKNSKKNKNKQNKIQQQKLKKKKIMSKYFYKFNLFFGIRLGFILFLSIVYFIITKIVTITMKNNYKEFDSVLEQINKVYFDSFNIYLTFKEQLQIYEVSNNLEELKIPKDSEVERPKLGNALMYITRNNKYSEESLKIVKNLYNNNACLVLPETELDKVICEYILSSILTKGMEQAIIQMSIIITSVIDELNSLKEEKTLYDLFMKNSSYSNYEIFVGQFMLYSFLKTQKIFEIFRNDEKLYIFTINRIILIIYGIIYFIFIFAVLYFIYAFKNIINSFFNFIGILPAKFIYDDDYLYKTILKLEQDFY